MRIEDGKASNFNAYRNGVDVGDHLEFQYSLSDGIVTIELKDTKRNETSVYVLAFIDDMLAYRDDERALTNKFGLYSYDGTIIFEPNRIIAQNRDGRIRLKRYYKDDWNGIATIPNENPLDEQILTLDCQPIQIGLDDLMLRFKNASKR